MAQSTAARARGRAGAGGGGRNPELDATRMLALVAAVAVLVAPAPLPDWLDGGTLAVADVLPAGFAVVSGAAIAHQVAARAAAGAGWWTARVLRRVALLVAAGVLLQVLVRLPSLATLFSSLRWESELAVLGIASGLAMLLARLPASTRVVLVVLLVVGHRAAPSGPEPVGEVVATLALVLVGTLLGQWVRHRPRGLTTVALLAALAIAAGAAAHALTDRPWVDGTLWDPALAAGAVALVAALLAVGQAATRRALTDRLVAPLAVAGRVTLPLWLVAVVADAWFLDTRPVRWLLREVLWPPLGATGAALALGALVGLALVRLGTAMADRGLHLRA